MPFGWVHHLPNGMCLIWDGEHRGEKRPKALAAEYFRPGSQQYRIASSGIQRGRNRMSSGTLPRAYGARLATLLGTASFLTMGSAIDAKAQGEVAQADEIPETVLITGSLIRGTTAVGVPVTNLSPQDFATT